MDRSANIVEVVYDAPRKISRKRCKSELRALDAVLNHDPQTLASLGLGLSNAGCAGSEIAFTILHVNATIGTASPAADFLKNAAFFAVDTRRFESKALRVEMDVENAGAAEANFARLQESERSKILAFVDDVARDCFYTSPICVLCATFPYLLVAVRRTLVTEAVRRLHWDADDVPVKIWRRVLHVCDFSGCRRRSFMHFVPAAVVATALSTETLADVVETLRRRRGFSEVSNVPVVWRETLLACGIPAQGRTYITTNGGESMIRFDTTLIDEMRKADTVEKAKDLLRLMETLFAEDMTGVAHS
jgi:hypothetical protein